jgi:hypothetical protein
VERLRSVVGRERRLVFTSTAEPTLAPDTRPALSSSHHHPPPHRQRLEGDVAVFLDVCGRIVGEMRGVVI